MKKRTLTIIFLVISFLGFLDATYLTIKHYKGEVPPCSIIIGCEVVTTSRYATVLQIPVALLGSIFYLSIVILSLAYLDTKKDGPLKLASGLTVVGFIASLYFLYLQVFIIKAICVWCIGSLATSTLLFIFGLTALISWPKNPPNSPPPVSP